MKYRARPVTVDAFTIRKVTKLVAGEAAPNDKCSVLELEDGRKVTAHAGMLARIDPRPGDYFVSQEDGYEYLNPKEVFERKYEPVSENPDVIAAQRRRAAEDIAIQSKVDTAVGEFKAHEAFQELRRRSAETEPCPDCAEAQKHANSDATTPGLFYDRCERHREGGSRH